MAFDMTRLIGRFARYAKIQALASPLALDFSSVGKLSMLKDREIVFSRDFREAIKMRRIWLLASSGQLLLWLWICCRCCCDLTFVEFTDAAEFFVALIEELLWC